VSPTLSLAAAPPSSVCACRHRFCVRCLPARPPAPPPHPRFCHAQVEVKLLDSIGAAVEYLCTRLDRDGLQEVGDALDKTVRAPSCAPCPVWGETLGDPGPSGCLATGT
jgi:hypothetical protein